MVFFACFVIGVLYVVTAIDSATCPSVSVQLMNPMKYYLFHRGGCVCSSFGNEM